GRDGRLNLEVGPLDRLHVLVAARGFGLGWQPLPTGRPAEATIALAPEQVLRGRMVDLKGEPAAGVKAKVVRILGELRGPRVPRAAGGGGAGRGVIPPPGGCGARTGRAGRGSSPPTRGGFSASGASARGPRPPPSSRTAASPARSCTCRPARRPMSP